jgi:hypothetical protein
MPDGTVIEPTGKSFHIDFCTVAHWNEHGQILEENLFYDLMGMLKRMECHARPSAEGGVTTRDQ